MKYFTTKQAAGLLRVTPAGIRMAIKRGSLESKKRGRDHFIAESEVTRYDQDRYRRSQE